MHRGAAFYRFGGVVIVIGAGIGEKDQTYAGAEANV